MEAENAHRAAAREEAKVQFKELDTNGDGTLTFVELLN